MENKINKNAFLNIIKNISSLLYPIITFPYVSRVLGPENIGKINFSSSVVGYFSLIAGLGIYTYGVRECAKVRDDKQRLNKIASQLFSLNVLSTIFAILAMFIVVNAFEVFESYHVLIYIFSTTFVFTTLGADWINTAFEDFKYITIRTVVMQLISLILLFLFVSDRGHYLIYSITVVLAQNGANIVNILYRRKYCTTRIIINRSLFKHLSSIVMLFSMSVLQTIFVNTDITILGLYRGDYEVGLYGTAAKLTRMVDLAIAAVVWVILPQMTEYYEDRNYDKMNHLLRYTLDMILVLGIPSVVGMIFISKELVGLFAGGEYIGAAVPLQVLAVGTFFSLLGGFVGNIIMLPMGREDVLLKSSIMSALINLVLNLIFIPMYGQIAASFTTLISYFVGFVYPLKYVDKNLRVEGTMKLAKGPLIECVVIVITSYLFKYLTNNDIVIATATIIISVVSYVVILYCVKDDFFMGYYIPIRNKINNKFTK